MKAFIFLSLTLFCINANSQTVYQIIPDLSKLVNPNSKKLLGISFDGRSSMDFDTTAVVNKVGYYEPSTGSIIPEIQPLWDQITPGGFRYPGNAVLYNWDWSKTIGPLSGRSPQALGPKGSQIQNLAFGFDEFMAMTLAKGIQPADVQIMVNLYTIAGYANPATQAADWVEYCNAPNDSTNPRGGTDWAALRAKNGHPLPYGIKIWNIGNEPWSFTEPNTSVHNETDYINQASDIIDSMLLVDPTLKITIPAVGNANSVWNKAMFSSKLIGKIYGLSPHAFYDEDVKTPNPTILQNETLLLNLAQKTNTLGLKLICGDHACYENPQIRDVSTKWKGALATADYLLMISQINSVERANYWIFGNAIASWRPIRKNTNGTYTLMAAGELYSIFSNSFLDKSYSTSVKDLSNNLGKKVRASTFLDNSGNNGTIIIVNTDTINSIQLTAPQLNNLNLQDANLISASNLYADQTTFFNVSANQNNNYDLPAGSILILNFSTTSNTKEIISENDFYLYPNPANTEIYLTKHLENFIIINQLGEELLQNSGNSFSTESLSNGVYFLKYNEKCIKFIINR